MRGPRAATPEDDETVEEDDGDELGDEDEDADEAEDAEEVEDAEDAEDAGDHCTADPTLLSDDELGAMSHGSIVCWAAHQTEWPAWFSGHGAFVRCWAHQGKADAASCTEDPNADEATGEEPAVESSRDVTSRGHGHAKGKGKSKNKD